MSLLPKPPESWDCRCMLPHTAQIVLKWGKGFLTAHVTEMILASGGEQMGGGVREQEGCTRLGVGKERGRKEVFDSHLKGWVGRGSLLIPPAVAVGGG